MRNKPGIEFRCRVHETVDKSLMEMDYKFENATQPFIHFGYLKGVVKTPFYRHLCLKELEDNPKNFEAYYNLGKIYFHEDKDYQKAVDFISESIKLGGNHYLIFHELAVAKYYLFLSKHQNEIKDIYDDFMKCKKTIPKSFPEFTAKLETNMKTVEKMIIKNEDKK